MLPLCNLSETEMCMLCLFCLISTKTLHVYLIYTQTNQDIWIGKILLFIQLFISFFFTHAANAAQVISVEATISGARVVFKTFALKYL